MITIHQSVMTSDGNREHQLLSFPKVFSGRYFGDAITRTHVRRMFHICKGQPWDSRIVNGVGMESSSFVQSGGGLQPLHFGFRLTDKGELIGIVLKGGKRKSMIGTPYCRFGKKTVIADYLVALDAVAEFLDFACGSDDTM